MLIFLLKIVGQLSKPHGGPYECKRADKTKSYLIFTKG